MEYVTIPLSIVCISIAWLPQILEYQTKPSIPSIDELPAKKNISLKSSLRTARYKMTLISSTVKIILTFVFAYGLNELKLTDTENIDMPLINGFRYLFKDSRFLWTFIVHILCGFVGQLGTWMACKVNLQRACFVLPFFLSTPIAILLVTPIFDEKYKTCEFLLDGCPNAGNPSTPETIVLGILLWISGLSFNIQFFNSQQFLMAKEEVLFWIPGYNGALLEQQLILNRKNEITDHDFVNYDKIMKKSHVYICTTMYHEADFEMEQLIQSLAEIDRRRKTEGTHNVENIEAHIFFDDGVRGTTIKTYALQLMSLFQATIGINPADTSKTATPYGLQMKYILRNGMLLVVHLKDKLKVGSFFSNRDEAL